jgi:hypothetical protein
MQDRRHLLKIKLKSLAAEAKIIKKAEGRLRITEPRSPIPREATKEEHVANPELAHAAALILRLAKRQHRAKFRSQPWYDANRSQLAEMQLHRVGTLRSAARATHLAYGFLRGRTYDQMEGTHKLPPSGTYERLIEDRLIADAAKMAAAYGAVGIPKCDIERDLKHWAEARNVRLVVEENPEFKTGRSVVRMAERLDPVPDTTPPTTEFGALLS